MSQTAPTSPANGLEHRYLCSKRRNRQLEVRIAGSYVRYIAERTLGLEITEIMSVNPLIETIRPLQQVFRAKIERTDLLSPPSSTPASMLQSKKDRLDELPRLIIR